MKRKSGLKMCVLWLILVALLPLHSHGATCFLTRVADKSTAIPGGSGNFTGLQDPVMGDDDVVFIGNSSLSQRGVYAKINGVLSRIADTSTPIPGGPGNFGDFDSCRISNGNVAFVGINGSKEAGIYTRTGSTLSKVADTSTPIPGGSGNFTKFSSLVMSGGNVAFVGYGSGAQQGIYTNIGGTLNKVADTNTPIPGGSGNFLVFNLQVVISNGNVAFVGYNSSMQPGIYTNIGGSLNRLADTGTPIPAGSGNFIDLEDPVISNGSVAFVGRGTGVQRGIYTNIGGTLKKLADTSTPVPGGSGDFEGFIYPAIDKGSVVFGGTSPGTLGIYTHIGSSLSRLADTDTLIPDSPDDVFVAFGPAVISNENVAFKASGSGEQNGIYAVIGGGLNRLADTSTPIPGGSGYFTIFENPVISNGYVAFRGFGNAQVGIYIASCPTTWTGSVSFPVRVTSAYDASGDRKFQNFTNNLSGKIEAYVGENGLVPNEGGCYIKVSGDDKTAICIKQMGSASTDVQKSRTDQLLLVGTGEMTLPIEGLLKPGVVYVDFKGALKKDGSGRIVSIGINGKLGCSGSDFVCAGSYRSTLTEAK